MGLKSYDVTVTGTAKRTYTLSAYSAEEAEDKALDLFGAGRAENYEFENVEIDWTDQSGD